METITIKNRSNEELRGYMEEWDACDPAREWFGTRDLKQALADAEKIGWVIWLARVLETECQQTEPAIKAAYKLIAHYYDRLQHELNQLEIEKANRQKPIWDEYYAARRAIVDPMDAQHTAELQALDARHAGPLERQMVLERHARHWQAREQNLEAPWQMAKDKSRPIEAWYTRKCNVRHRAALRAIRRRIVVQD